MSGWAVRVSGGYDLVPFTGGGYEGRCDGVVMDLSEVSRLLVRKESRMFASCCETHSLIMRL